MDDYDRKILRELQADARIKNSDLADLVGLSATACWRRVKILEEQGVIGAYTTVLEPTAIGLKVCVFVNVTLSKHGEGSVKDFAEKVILVPQVLDCYLMTGDSDFLLRVAVRDIEDFENFLNEFLLPIPGIDQVKSSFALKQYKNSKSLPI